jgi:DNA-binding transcriptional regulator YiaG
MAKPIIKKRKEANRFANMEAELKDWKAGKIKFKVSILDDDGKGRFSWEESGPESKARYERLAQFKAIRAELGLSQSAFAKALRVATKTLQGWEIGKPIPEPVFVLVELIHDMPAVRKRLLAA